MSPKTGGAIVDLLRKRPATSAKDRCGTWCATNTLEDGTHVAVPISCRSWDCVDCAKKNKRRLLRRLHYAKPNLFATLTTSERTATTPEEAFARANAALPILFKRWRRARPGVRLDYFLVWERTKRGWPHIHLLLVGAAVPKRWLSRQWLELTGCYIVDLQPLGSIAHAAGYLTKYLTKDPQVPAGFRRWRRTAGFFNTAAEPPPFRLPTTGQWKIQPGSVRSQALIWFNDGLAINFERDGMLKARRAPDIWLHQVRDGTREKLLRAMTGPEMATH